MPVPAAADVGKVGRAEVVEAVVFFKWPGRFVCQVKNLQAVFGTKPEGVCSGLKNGPRVTFEVMYLYRKVLVIHETQSPCLTESKTSVS